MADIKIILTPTDLPTRQAVAAFDMLSHGVMTGLIPAPREILCYRHDVDTEEFLTWADRYQGRVDIQEGTRCAVTRLRILDEFENGIAVEYILFCNDLSDGARRAYATHNEECIAK